MSTAYWATMPETIATSELPMVASANVLVSSDSGNLRCENERATARVRTVEASNPTIRENAVEER